MIAHQRKERARIGIDGQWLMPAGGAGGRLRDIARQVAESGLGLVNVGDHISFHDGTGFDGMVNAMAWLASAPELDVQIGIYQIPARHPVLIARQVVSIAELAPGRLALGVGVGGEDPAELRMVGVDPATRGRRADEYLEVLRSLLAGQVVDHHGEFVTIEQARVLPAPLHPVPILIGGRSDAALRRTAEHGDGWLGIWLSVQRFAGAIAQIAEQAEGFGRTDPPVAHAMQFWCGFDHDGTPGADRLRATMEGLYGLPFDRFARWCPTGSPQAVAEFVAPYLQAGCTTATLIPAGLDAGPAIDLVGRTAQLVHELVPQRAR